MGWFPSSSSRTHFSSGRRPAYSRVGGTRSAGTRSAGSSGGPSYYKRRPRDGYLDQLVRKLKQLLGELLAYARRHPYKVFLAVVMPLLSSGVLQKIASQLGIRLPDQLTGRRSIAARGGRAGGGGYYGSRGYGDHDGEPGGGVADFMGSLGNVENWMRMARSVV